MPPIDSDCIFCKIAAGSIPCHKLYEDDNIIAFLDVFPLSKGHALVIPKGHWVTLDVVPSEISASIGKLLPGIASSICKATGTPDFNILQNNGKLAHQAVGHVHFHIIPKTNDSGLGINWPAGKLDPAMATELVAQITGAL